MREPASEGPSTQENHHAQVQAAPPPLSAPFLDQIPAQERTRFLAQLAETRALIAESRTDVLKPSPTPTLDALIQQAAGAASEAARRG